MSCLGDLVVLKLRFGADMKKILFVCMGNICRSPAAEGVMQNLVASEGLEQKIYLDSAGTIGYHIGERADSRMRSFAQKRGIDLLSISRSFDPMGDFEEFDYIIAMDDCNMEDLLNMDVDMKYREKLHMMTDFCRTRKEKKVPDPYYGGECGFDLVLDIVEDACNGLLDRVKKEI